MVDDLRAPLSADPREVAFARHQLTDHLILHGLPEDVTDTAVLLMSELVTNAIMHGEPPVELIVQGADDDALRVEVRDGDRESFALLQPQSERASYRLGGRGLQLVDSLSARWGACVEGRIKSVWFEIDLR